MIKSHTQLYVIYDLCGKRSWSVWMLQVLSPGKEASMIPRCQAVSGPFIGNVDFEVQLETIGMIMKG